MKQYETCPHCIEARAQGDAVTAKSCPVCKGCGFRRVPSSFLCNKCGGPLCPIGTMNADVPHGLVEAIVSGGYDSHHLFDGTNYEFSVCEKCLRQFFDTCVIPPAISYYLGGSDNPTYSDDRAAYLRRMWRDTGGDIEKLSRGLCNVTIECDQKATWRQFCSSNLTERAMCDGHKRSVRFANSYEVPAAWVEGIPVKGDLTPEQRKSVAWAWLRSAVVPGAVTYFQYIGGCVAEYVGRDPCAATKEDSSGAIWFPPSDMPADWASTLQHFTFDDGTLAVGSYHEVRAIVAAANGKRKIVPAPILPHLHDEDDASPPDSV